ncbi:MAG TPA: ATP-binding protein, partial [Elusimicrobiota bacterium]|nr:ATP-binding protein [Elusimicrobiota bacterium]
PDCRFVLFNRAGEELLGYRRTDLMGKNDYDFFPKDEADFFTAKDRQVLAGKAVLDIPEEPIQTRRQGRRVLHTKKIPILDKRGNPLYLLGISEDITERKAAENALLQKTRELERSNAELEQFAYIASHDLQEPLRKIMLYCQMLEQSYRGRLDAQADGMVDVVLRAAQRMQTLIQDLLSYAHVSRGEQPRQVVESRLAYEEALGNLEALAAQCGADIRCDPLPRVMADRSQLVQLFQNLLGNALKFRGSRPPEVRVHADRKGKQWQFSIQDNGIGIAPQYLERIFVIFQRLHARDVYPGTGIGLAICKKIVERHDGRIWAESTPGKGSTFRFTLPAEDA